MFDLRKQSTQGTGMSRFMIKPNLLENRLVVGDAGICRKNKIVPFDEFSFELLPKKWLHIERYCDDDGVEMVNFWYEL